MPKQRSAGAAPALTLAAAARRVRADAGDRVAERALFDRCMQPRARAWILATYPSLGRDADDILQDAFVAFYRYCRRHDAADAAALWSLVVRRMCASYLRARRRLQETSERRAPEPLDARPSPEGELIERERRAAVVSAIGEVEREQWRDVLLHLLEGELPREGCARMGLSPGHYAVVKHRARKAAARVARMRSALRDACRRDGGDPRDPRDQP